MRAIPLFAIPLLVAASAHARPIPPAPPPVEYSCEDGLRFTVRFTREAAHVTLPSGEEMLLPRQRSGSGMAYGTDQSQLRGKGDEATWTSGRRPPVGCRVRR